MFCRLSLESKPLPSSPATTHVGGRVYAALKEAGQAQPWCKHGHAFEVGCVMKGNLIE